MHRSFIAKFEEVVHQWARTKNFISPNKLELHPVTLEDDVCDRDYTNVDLDPGIFWKNHVRKPSEASSSYSQFSLDRSGRPQSNAGTVMGSLMEGNSSNAQIITPNASTAAGSGINTETNSNAASLSRRDSFQSAFSNVAGRGSNVESGQTPRPHHTSNEEREISRQPTTSSRSQPTAPDQLENPPLQAPNKGITKIFSLNRKKR
jgi:hypothetical protein